MEAGIEADNTISAAEIMMEDLHKSHTEAPEEEVWRTVLKVKEALVSARSDQDKMPK